MRTRGELASKAPASIDTGDRSSSIISLSHATLRLELAALHVCEAGYMTVQVGVCPAAYWAGATCSPCPFCLRPCRLCPFALRWFKSVSSANSASGLALIADELAYETAPYPRPIPCLVSLLAGEARGQRHFDANLQSAEAGAHTAMVFKRESSIKLHKS